MPWNPFRKKEPQPIVFPDVPPTEPEGDLEKVRGEDIFVDDFLEDPVDGTVRKVIGVFYETDGSMTLTLDSDEPGSSEMSISPRGRYDVVKSHTGITQELNRKKRRK